MAATKESKSAPRRLRAAAPTKRAMSARPRVPAPPVANPVPPGAATPQAAANLLRVMTPMRPKLGIVLGSGFHQLAGEMRVAKEVRYPEIPGFLQPSVAGHAGRLLFGYLGATPVAVLSGRTHFYEGHSMETVTFAVRTLAALGVEDLLLTNAAGGIKRGLKSGDFMLVTDHINFIGVNPLRGAESTGLPRFVDLSCAYDPLLGRLLQEAAHACGLELREGVYLAVSGPSYETPAEVRAFARLGADAVGMSTVPEAIAARQCGLRVVAVSCITNLAAGSGPPLSHAEVLQTAERVKGAASLLLKTFAKLHGQHFSP